jgi:hypothetical protein
MECATAGARLVGQSAVLTARTPIFRNHSLVCSASSGATWCAVAICSEKCRALHSLRCWPWCRSPLVKVSCVTARRTVAGSVRAGGGAPADLVRTWNPRFGSDFHHRIEASSTYKPCKISAPDPREYGILSRAISVAHSRANTDMPRAELVDMATTINPAGLMLDQLNNELIAKLEHLRQLEACHHTWTWPAGGRP